MIRKNGTFETEQRLNMRGGDGTIRIEHLWKPGELKTRTRLCARLLIEPGCSIGPHQHAAEEEVYIVIRGHGRIIEGDTVTKVGPGDTVLTGDGASHAVACDGDETLEMIAVIMQY